MVRKSPMMKIKRVLTTTGMAMPVKPAVMATLLSNFCVAIPPIL